MKLNNLPSIKATSAKRVGRGLSSGKGKTAGRGTKGQKSRSGYNIPRRFEGGQTALIQKLPKVRGFKSLTEKPLAIQITRIEEKYNDGEVVTLKTLKAKGFVKNGVTKVKILGPGKITKKLKFRDVILTKALYAQYSTLSTVKSSEINPPAGGEVEDQPKADQPGAGVKAEVAEKPTRLPARQEAPAKASVK